MEQKDGLVEWLDEPRCAPATRRQAKAAPLLRRIFNCTECGPACFDPVEAVGGVAGCGRDKETMTVRQWFSGF